MIKNTVSAPYLNVGNPLVLSMVPDGVHRILDVGCGGGGNARSLRARKPDIEMIGLTHSAEEAAIASANLDAVHVIDLETGLTDAEMAEWGKPFDLLLFSHVLEHLKDPVGLLMRCLTRLKPGGYVLISVPNVLEWRTRMQFLCGRFVYVDHGILDRTHIRFFTYETAAQLVTSIEGLQLQQQQGRGSVPLGPLRRVGVARGLCTALDRAGTAWRPNLFCGETAMLAQWIGQAK